jgi:hypothetical protein
VEAELKIVRGREAKNEAVAIDSTEFVDCRFQDCELIYSGGLPFIFENTSVDGCELVFVGRAENTLHTLAAMHRFGMHLFVEQMFERIRNPILDPNPF